MKNKEVVKAIIELFKDRRVSGHYFEPNTYEKEEFIPHIKMLGGLPVENVEVYVDPFTLEPDGRLVITAYGKRGNILSLPFDGSEDENFYNLLDEIYYCTCGPEDPDLEDWLKKKGFEI